MIGTLRETSLHAALKQWYAQPGDQFEVDVDGYVVDLRRGDTIIEIQTRSFAAIRRKLIALTTQFPVRLVHPIAREKYIVRFPAGKSAEPISRRKSPKRGTVEQLFIELVSFPDLITHPNFTLEIVLTREEEIQRRGRGGSWRRKGWKVVDRRLIDVADTIVFESPPDFLTLLPTDLPDSFTSRDLAEAGDYSLYPAQKMTYCLRRMGAIEVVGKRRGSLLYLH